MPDLRLFYFGQFIMVTDCRCFNHSRMAYDTSKPDFQNENRFENLSCIAIAAIWIIYGIFRKCGKNLWRAFGFTLLVLIPMPIAITHISAYFLPQVQFDFTSDKFNSGIILTHSLVCFGIDYLFYHRKGDVTDKK